MHDLIQILTVVGIVVFILCITASRIVAERALRTLASDQKLALLETFSWARAYYFIPIAVLVILYVVVRSLLPEHSDAILYGLLFLCALGVLGMYGYGFYKIRQLDLPRSYLFRFGLSRVISLLGVLVLVAGLTALRIW